VNASLDETKRFAERAERGWLDGTEWDFVITEAGEAIGNIGLNRFIPLWRTCNVGYWMRSDRCGRGYMTEAASAAVEFGFTRVNAHRIELSASPDNPGSWRIAEKLGFRREGVLRDACWAGRGFMDMYMYGLLATDARPRFH
jgi:ribosomal-protein-serine acetyltransferase